MDTELKTWQKILCSLVAIVLFIALFLLTGLKKNYVPKDATLQKNETLLEKIEDILNIGSKKYLQYDIVILGDSILGLQKEEGSVGEIISDELSMSVLNAAFGGTTLSHIDYKKEMSYTKENYAFVSLANSLVTRDFGPQESSFVRESNTQDFGYYINLLDQTDFTKTKYLIMEYGINDYHAGTIIDGTDKYDTYTMLGAFRTAIEKLQDRYPNLKIIMLTPTYSWYLNTGLDCEQSNFGGGFLVEYVDALKNEALKYNINVVDLYNDFYTHENFDDYKLYTKDGVHPNDLANKMIAERLLEAIRGEK